MVNLGVKPLFIISAGWECSIKGSVFWDALREIRYEEGKPVVGKEDPFHASRKCEEY